MDAGIAAAFTALILAVAGLVAAVAAWIQGRTALNVSLRHALMCPGMHPAAADRRERQAYGRGYADARAGRARRSAYMAGEEDFTFGNDIPDNMVGKKV